jgi:hypothetical protein
MGPPPGAPRRRLARPLVITGVVAVVVGAGAGVAAAVTGGSNPSTASAASAQNPAASPTPSSGGADKYPRIRVGIPFGGIGLGAPFGAVHGEFVVPKSGGGYQTMDTQRGSVTAVSNSSITIKSGDGFTKTYGVTGDTIVDAKRDGIGSIKVGDQVFVMATVSGSTATAANVTDVSNLQQLRPKFFGGPPPSSSG